MNLYHYTSNESFISIVQGKKLHLSSLNVSNDKQEGIHFFDQLKNILFNKLGCCDQENYEFHMRKICEDEGAVGFCFSEESDLLSQWRAYANDGAGVSIGFNKEKLDELITANPKVYKGMHLKKIIYSQTIEDKLSLENINNLVKRHQLNFKKKSW